MGQTATSSLSLELNLEHLRDRELYESLDWLHKRQRRIENKLARNHLSEGTLVLYDVSSSYYTGRCGGLVKFGYSRDRKRGFPQIVYGLLCNAEGCPVAVEVFEGNTADPAHRLKSVANKRNAAASGFSEWSWSATAA